VSCGLHDVVSLEARGTPAVLVGTTPFRAEAEEQARVLGQPGQTMIEVAHPIQPVPAERIAGFAERVLAEAVQRLTG
jgi:hypothetical protein